MKKAEPTGKKVDENLNVQDAIQKGQDGQKVSPEMQQKIMSALREQELTKKGLKVAGQLSKEDFEYFKNLGMKELDLAQKIGVIEVQKLEMIEHLKEVNKNKGTFEIQLIEKMGLTPGQKYQIDTNTRDIIVQMTPEELAQTKEVEHNCKDESCKCADEKKEKKEENN